MRAAIILGTIAILAFAAVTADAQSRPDLKQKIIVQTDKSGVRIASSSAIAEVKRSSRYVNGGKGTASVFVFAQKKEGLPAIISLVANSTDAVMQTEVQDVSPSTPDEQRGFVGDPWREVQRETLERSVKCGPSSEEWCTLTAHYKLNLSAEDVRALLQQKGPGISVSRYKMGTEWTLPKDHLIAALDALGVLDEFR